MKKLSLKEAKKLSFNTLNKLINQLREHLKTDDTMIEAFKKYKIDIDELNYIPMTFDNIDVSAKTEHCIIIFNYKLLLDGDFSKNYSYGIHEVVHFLQQSTGDKPTQSADDGNYLENGAEQEGFQNQIKYIADTEGEKEAEKYVDDLLDYHDVDKKKEKELENTLLKKL